MSVFVKMRMPLTIGVAAVIAATASATETIAYWPFGTNGFHDVSGNGHDLTSTTVTESDAGYVTLDGTSQFLTTASALDLSGETAVTFECWTRSTGKHGTVDALFSSANPGSTAAGSLVLYYTGKLQAQFSMGTGWHIDYTASSSAMDDGMWHHIAYVIDRTNTGSTVATLYLDGVPVTNAESPAGSAPLFLSETFFIGGGSKYCENANFFTGYIDDVRISRGALTPDQFLKFPSVGKAMRADDGKLPVVAYWPFGGNRGKDATGNGFDLVMGAVPMVSGTPNVSFNDRNSWSGDFKCTNMQFSVFSKTGMTIEFFAKSGSGSTEAGNILTLSPNQNYYNNAGAFRIGPSSSGHTTMQAVIRRKDSGKFAQSSTDASSFGALNDSKWRHFAVVYNPSDTEAIVKMYVDGVPATPTDDAPTQGAIALLDTTLYFQRINYSGAASGFVGSFDDVRITAGVLTPDQFLPARSAGSTVALYRFDRETIEDQSGNGNNLVLKNGVEPGDGTPTFGDNGLPESGTGLVFTGKNDGKEWVRTIDTVDFSGTKSMTIEVDYVCPNPKAEDGSSVYVFAASTNATSRGGFVMYRAQNSFSGQFRKNASGWLSAKSAALGTATSSGYRRGRYVVNANNADGNNKVYFTLTVDGTAYPETQSDTFDSLGKLGLSFGHCPVYYGGTSSEPCYMKGKLLRVAVSDMALNTEDYVLDNLVLDTPKSTLAYWDFKGSAGLSSDDVPRRKGALNLDGASSASTTNITLAALTQATIECFVCFGETPYSGTLFSMGSGAGSFVVTSDATAGTLSGSFMPYYHLAASCGGATALAPLAGKKTWHHVALVIDRTKPGADAVRFYVDYERTMPAGRAWDAASSLIDGTLSVGDGFTGMLDDLRVSAGALSPQEFLHERTEDRDGMAIILR